MRLRQTRTKSFRFTYAVATFALAAMSLPANAIEPADSPPITRHRTPLVYPENARRLALHGTTVLRLKISVTGQVSRAQIKKSSNYPILDQAALNCARSWTFQPAFKAGKPVVGEVETPVEFKIEPGGSGRFFYHTGDLVAPLPSYPSHARLNRDYGHIVLGVTWKTDGTVENVRVLAGAVSGSADSLSKDILPFVRGNWKLTPKGLSRYQPGAEAIVPIKFELR